MSNQIHLFTNPQFGEVRVAVADNNEPMFCLADVCRALGLKNTSATKSRLRTKGINQIKTLTNGGPQSLTYVDEANLYKCVFASSKPEAEKFQDWVCDEVLPSIRKTGGYIVARDEESPEDIMARALVVAQATLERQAKRLAEQSAQMEEDAPKVAFANAVIASKSSCLIGELAKLITQNGKAIGQNRLFVWMRNHGYLGTRGEQYNIPHQQYIEQGLFELKKGVRSGSDGVMKTTITPKVTAKGQQYFINKFIAASGTAC